MKSLKLLIVFLIALTPYTSEAQFLKKIGKKAEEAAERTVLRKTDEKTSQKVGKGIDNTVDGKKGNKKKKKKSKNKNTEAQNTTPQQQPYNNQKAAAFEPTYNFSYKYVMRVSSAQNNMENMTMEFWLEPNVSYMGMNMSQQGMEMFQIMDSEKETAYSFINASGNKMASSTNYGGYVNNEQENYEDYSITTLPNKTILGYNCIGKQFENDEWKTIFYFTNDVDVSINNMFQTDASQNVPAELKKHFNPDDNNLIMYIEMIDKKQTGKKDRSGKMECISFEKENFTFNTSGYKSY